MVDVEEGIRLQVGIGKNILNTLQLDGCRQGMSCFGVLD
jgi:hypothetical protein